MKYKAITSILVSFALVPYSAHAQNPQKTPPAKMISTTEVISELSRAELQTKIETFLDRADVQAQMQKSGVSPEEAALRLASLSSQELQQVSNQIEAGRNGGILELILVIILILILVGRI